VKVSCRACGHEVEIPSGALSAVCPSCHARIDVTALETRASKASATLEEPPEALIGVEIDGHRLVRVIGRGGMGVVYEGAGSEKRVAIKVLAPELRRDEQLIERFQREAEALTRLRHPNLIEVYAHGIHEGGRPYFVMELFDGEDLRTIIARGSVPHRTAAAIISGAALGLAHAHAHGVVHRDVKPANILVRGDPARGGAVKVVDFGVARIAAGEHPLTSSALIIGTLNYMAPEQRLDASVIDRRADIYALGVVAYELLTGKLPLGAFAVPSELSPSLPSRVDRVIISALRQDLDRRTSDVERFATDLDRALRARSFNRPIALGGVAIVLAIAGAFGLQSADPVKVEPQEVRVEPPVTKAIAQEVPEPPKADPVEDLADLMVEAAQEGARRAEAEAKTPEPEKKRLKSAKPKLEVPSDLGLELEPKKQKAERKRTLD
jgi:serine/threonine protein kinase